MNATVTKCSILAGLVTRRSKNIFEMAFFGRTEGFLHPACITLDLRKFHTRPRDLRGRIWSVTSNRRPTLANFSSQKDQIDSRKSQGKSSGDQTDGKSSVQPPELTVDEEMKKLGLFARFKKMYKEYWYVLLPAHVVTSVIWFGSFYYLSTRYDLLN